MFLILFKTVDEFNSARVLVGCKPTKPEAYLQMIKISDVRKSLIRFRISCHNVYIERGRYATPLVLLLMINDHIISIVVEFKYRGINEL